MFFFVIIPILYSIFKANFLVYIHKNLQVNSFFRFHNIIGPDDLITVDPVRGRFLQQLQDLSARKARILQDNTLSTEARAHQVQNLALSGGVRLEDLALTFQYLPSSRAFGIAAADLVYGAPDVEVTLENVEEYTELTTSFCLERGISRQMEAFHAGFCRVFPMDKLRAFSPEEVRVMLCGDQNPQWTREDLLTYTEPKLGYTRDRLVGTVVRYVTC